MWERARERKVGMKNIKSRFASHHPNRYALVQVHNAPSPCSMFFCFCPEEEEEEKYTFYFPQHATPNSHRKKQKNKNKKKDVNVLSSLSPAKLKLKFWNKTIECEIPLGTSLVASKTFLSLVHFAWRARANNKRNENTLEYNFKKKKKKTFDLQSRRRCMASGDWH